MKQNDHLMDATRYLIVSGWELMRTKPVKEPALKNLVYFSETQNLRWMQ